MTITPEQAEIIEKAIESHMIDVHTALPGKVQKVYPAVPGVRDLGADIVLELKRTLPKSDKEYTTEDLPVLKNVPIWQAGSSDFFLAFALAPGDQGYVIFSEQSIDQWRTKGVNTSPGDIGRHTLTGGVFFPGLRSVAKVLTDVLTSGFALGKKGGCQLRSPAGATMEVTTGGAPAATDFVAMAAKVFAAWFTLDTVIRTAWIPVPQDGGAAFKTAYLAAFPTPPTLASFASTNLKAD